MDMADLAVAILCCDIPTIIPNTCPKWEIIKTDGIGKRNEWKMKRKERERVLSLYICSLIHIFLKFPNSRLDFFDCFSPRFSSIYYKGTGK